MSEEKKDEIKKIEPVVKEIKEEKPSEVIESKEPTMVDEAKETVDRMEKANTKKEELIIREEKLHAEKLLGGKTDAGSVAKTEDEKVIEGAKKLLAGTGYEDMFDEKPTA